MLWKYSVVNQNFRTGIMSLVKVSCSNIEVTVTLIGTHVRDKRTYGWDLNFVKGRRSSLAALQSSSIEVIRPGENRIVIIIKHMFFKRTNNFWNRNFMTGRLQMSHLI